MVHTNIYRQCNLERCAVQISGAGGSLPPVAIASHIGAAAGENSVRGAEPQSKCRAQRKYSSHGVREHLASDVVDGTMPHRRKKSVAQANGSSKLRAMRIADAHGYFAGRDSGPRSGGERPALTPILARPAEAGEGGFSRRRQRVGREPWVACAAARRSATAQAMPGRMGCPLRAYSDMAR